MVSTTTTLDQVADDILSQPGGHTGPTADVLTAADQLKATFRTPHKKVELTPVASLKRTTEWLASLTNFITSLNDLSKVTPTRDPECGKLLMAWTAEAMSKQRPQHANEKFFNAIYAKTHRAGINSDEAQFIPHGSLLGLNAYIDIQAKPGKLPAAAFYLERSESLRTKFYDLSRQAGEIDQKLAPLLEQQTRAQAKGKDPMGDIISKLQGQKEELLEKIDQLCLNELFDVDLESTPECLNAMSLTVCERPELIKLVINFKSGLEKTLEEIFGNQDSATQTPADKIDVRAVQIYPGGQFREENYKFDRSKAAIVSQKQDLIAEMLHAINVIREFLRRIEAKAEKFPNLALLKSDIGDALRQPFILKGSSSGCQTLQSLLEYKDPDVRREIVILMRDADGAKTPGKSDLFAIDNGYTLRPLAWVILRSLSGSDCGFEPGKYRELLSCSSKYGPILGSLLDECAGYLKANDFGELSRCLSRAIDASNSSTDPVTILAPILVLGQITSRTDWAKGLKNRISNLDVLRGLISKAGFRRNSASEKETTMWVDEISENLALSMRDYYRDSTLDPLWRMIDNFKLFVRFKDMRPSARLKADEWMSSGILLVGRPGTGKTFFVNLLKTELKAEVIKISFVGQNQEEVMDGIKKDIERAKELDKEGKPCIIFIDEAEAVLRSRRGRLTAEQETRTCFLLQEIGDLRQNHPLVLIIAASNFPERIDEAMLRAGRFDIQIEMSEPKDELREQILIENIKEFYTNLFEFTDEQVKLLIEKSRGLMPLAVKRPLIEYSFFGKMRAKAHNIAFTPSFDEIVELIEHEVEKMNTPLAKRLRKKTGGNGKPKSQSVQHPEAFFSRAPVPFS